MSLLADWLHWAELLVLKWSVEDSRLVHKCMNLLHWWDLLLALLNLPRGGSLVPLALNRQYLLNLLFVLVCRFSPLQGKNLLLLLVVCIVTIFTRVENRRVFTKYAVYTLTFVFHQAWRESLFNVLRYYSETASVQLFVQVLHRHELLGEPKAVNVAYEYVRLHLLEFMSHQVEISSCQRICHTFDSCCWIWVNRHRLLAEQIFDCMSNLIDICTIHLLCMLSHYNVWRLTSCLGAPLVSNRERLIVPYERHVLNPVYWCCINITILTHCADHVLEVERFRLLLNLCKYCRLFGVHLWVFWIYPIQS